jgi:polyferredoxin
MFKNRKTLFVVLVFVIAESALFFFPVKQNFSFDSNFTLKEFARLNDIKPGKIKKDLGKPLIRGKTTLAELDIDKNMAFELISHVKGKFATKKMAFIQAVFALFTALSVILLIKNKMGSAVKVVMLLISVSCFGFLLGKAYNPMVSLVKFMKGIAGIEANVLAWFLTLTCFSLLAVIGTKSVCGWVCPFGALQELVYKIPGLRGFKTRYKIPFWISNIIRVFLFAICIAALVLNLFELKEQGRVIYHVINPFNLFELNFSLVSILVYIVATFILSYLFYRPHCYLVCPFGLFSWLLEKVSVYRVRIDQGKCTDCKACVNACPGLAMKGAYERKLFSADCFSCGECLDSCKFDALFYSCNIRKD